MGQELLYTSAPRGLKPGSRGFCTVLSTRGMPAPLATAVEALSGYRPVFPANDAHASLNPIVYSHLKLQATGRSWHVLSRIADYGLDYSQRANKLAHHVILDNPSEQLPGGPANLLSMPGFMRTEWIGDPKVVDLKPIRLEPEGPTGVCRHWEQVTGDAGWAGVLAESFLNDPERLVILLFKPGQQVLPLFAEAIALLPPEERWNVTFSTYFMGLVTGTICQWRAILYDSKEANESLRFVTAIRIDLTQNAMSRAAGGDLVDAARTGDVLPSGPALPFSGRTRTKSEGDEAQRLVSRHTPSINSPYPKVHGRTEPPDLVLQPRGLARARRRWIKSPVFWIIGLPVACLIAIGFWSVIQIPQLRTQAPKQVEAPENSDQPTSEVGLNGVEPPSIQVARQQDGPHDQASVPRAFSESSAMPRPGTQGASPIQVLLDLPTTAGSVLLLDFEKEPQFKTTTPEVRVLIPHWLSSAYVATKSKQAASDTSDVLCTISVPATENAAVARIEEIRGDSRYFKFKAVRDDRLNLFSWCRLRVVNSSNPGEILKEFRFADFPVDVPRFGRSVGIGPPTTWKLPKALTVDTVYKPSFDLKSFSVACYGRKYELAPHTNGSLSWNMPCTEINSQFREMCNPSNDRQSNLPRLSIALDIRLRDTPSVQITLVGYAESVEAVEVDLNQQCKVLEARLPSNNIKGVQEKLSLAEFKRRKSEVLSSIEAPDKGELKKEEQTLLRNQVNELNDRIEAFEVLRTSLQDIKIVVCRISYALPDPDDGLPVAVEVIDINDRPEASQNTIKGPQP